MAPIEPGFFGRLHPELRQLVLQEIAESSNEGRTANFWQVLNTVAQNHYQAPDYMPVMLAQFFYEGWGQSKIKFVTSRAQCDKWRSLEHYLLHHQAVPPRCTCCHLDASTKEEGFSRSATDLADSLSALMTAGGKRPQTLPVVPETPQLSSDETSKDRLTMLIKNQPVELTAEEQALLQGLGGGWLIFSLDKNL